MAANIVLIIVVNAKYKDCKLPEKSKMWIGMGIMFCPKSTPKQTSQYLVLPSALKYSKQIKVIVNVQIAIMQSVRW